MVEGLQRQNVQGRDEGDVRSLAERVAEAKRPMRGQLGHQAVGHGGETLVLLRLGVWLRRHDGLVALIAGGHRAFIVAVRVRLGRRLGRQFVFRSDIAPLDAKLAISADADEGAGTRDLGGVEHDGPVAEALDQRL